MGWKPLTDAQKDGRVYMLGDSKPGVMFGFWDKYSKAWDDGDYKSRETWPTHWYDFGRGRNIPKPPVSE